MHKIVLRRVLWLFLGAMLMGLMLTAFTGQFHPGCLVVVPPENSVPGVPGLPCLPTTPPPPSSPAPGETPSAPTEKSGTKPTSIRVTIWNESELPFSMTLIGAQTYILNVQSGETKVFVVDRGAYSFNMMLCGVGAQGAMSLNKITRLKFKSCWNVKMVEVSFTNKTSEGAVATLSGPGSFVFSIPPGETRKFTIPRGEYVITQMACGGTDIRAFEARSHQTFELVCP